LRLLHKEVGRMKEINKKLKLDLYEIMNNYQNLQMRLFSFMQQEHQGVNNALPGKDRK
ncbi:hypothetical protein KI387_003008, partial [Taxus chinensis]